MHLVQNLRMFKKKEGASDRTFINNKQVASYLKIGVGRGNSIFPAEASRMGGGGGLIWNLDKQNPSCDKCLINVSM